MECNCPKASSLTVIDKAYCPVNLGQIQRVLFQRAGFVFDAGLVEDPNPIQTLASWTPLLAFDLANDTKVISSPLMEDFKIGQPEKKSEGGGDNTTLNGVERILGAGAVPVTANLVSLPGSIVKQLRELMCETELFGDVVVYLVNQYGQIAAKRLNPETITANQQQYTGFDMGSLFIADQASEGYNTVDKAVAGFAFSFAAGWRDDLELIKPSFNAKTLLWNAIA